MEDVGTASDIVEGLKYLIPGFISVMVFRSFTARPHNTTFESVVLALVFTFVAGLVTELFSLLLLRLGAFYSIGELTKDGKTALSALFALMLGVAASTFANRDVLHKIARALRLTTETSYPTQWYSSFQSRNHHVTLHLKDGRRIYGWPEEWPSQPDKGHFLISEPTWLDSGGPVNAPNSCILVAALDIELVEFVSGGAP